MMRPLLRETSSHQISTPGIKLVRHANNRLRADKLVVSSVPFILALFGFEKGEEHLTPPFSRWQISLLSEPDEATVEICPITG